MSEYRIQSETLEAIGDAIREKTGGSSLINPEDMADEIEGLVTGDPYEMLLAINNNTATSISLGDTVASVRPYMFWGNTNLNSFDFSHITTIRQGAFYRSGLSGNIVIPLSVRLENLALRECPMQTITFKGGVDRFDTSVFEGCSSLRIIDARMTSSITGRFDQFYYTGNLNTLILRQNYVYPMNGPFSNSCGLATAGNIYVPQNLLENYRTATNWSRYAERIISIEGSTYETYYADGTVIS